MRYFITPVLILLCHFAAAQNPVTSEQEVLSLENKLLEAIINRDAAFISSLYDDSYVGVIPTGHMVNKNDIVEYFTSGSPYVKVSFEEVKVRVINTVAIATGMMLTKSKSGTIIGQTRFMRVYEKKGEAWKVVEAQGTVVILR